MLRIIAGKLALVGRTASMLFGLALVAGAVLGAGSIALGANGSAFILGVLTNSATAVTRLTGHIGGKPALLIVNQSTAPGSHALQLAVAEGKPPLIVNPTAGLAPNLNADRLDGKHANQLLRIAEVQGDSPAYVPDGEAVIATISITAPAKGFVQVTGAATAQTPLGSTGFKAAHLRIRDVNTAQQGRWSSAAGEAYWRDELTTASLFPVQPGQRTYQLVASWFGTSVTVDRPMITALYVPFGPTGTLTPSSQPASAAKKSTLRTHPDQQ